MRGISNGNARDLWGLLKDRRGAEALQSSKAKLPERYQRLLENYFKALSKSGN